MGSYDAKRRGLHPLGTHLLVVIFAAAFLFAGTAAVVIAGLAGPASAQAEGTYGCPPGSFFDGDGCYLVPIGSYQPYQGWDEAFACPLPTSTASTGATDSAQCNVLPGPGQYASDQVFYAITQPFDVVVFQLCAPGTYQPFEGQTSCYAAPPGSYIDVSGATEIDEARPCPGGTYSTGGAAACADAPPGTAPGNFNGGWGATDVVNCNPGTTSPGGQYSCDPAPPGSYEPYYGEASPFTCAAGTYQPGYGATACILADVDHYVPGEGATSELSCPAGTHQPVTGSSSCLLDQTITFVAPADQVVGATLALEATATSGLPVEFTSLTPIVCSVTGSSVTANSTGTCTLQAGQAGDSTWNAAAPSEQSFAVTAVTTTSITSSPATPVVGQPVTYTATVAVVPPGSGTPTGAVTFTGNSGPLCTSPLNQSSPDTASCTTTYTSLLPAASDTVSAAYAGDGNFLYSTSPLLTVPITQAANTTSLTVDDANPVVGQSVTFTATVAVSAPGAATPTGMVTFTGGAGILCEPTLSSTSPFTATCRTSYPAAGSDSVFAVYSGDLNDQVGISNSVAMSISASTTTALATTDSTPVVGQTVTFTATVAPSAPGAATPTGMVTFASGSGTLCTSTLSSTSPYTATCTTSFASVGNTAVTATYNGGPNFTGSASSPLGETISAAQTTSTLSANVSSSVTNQQITFTADVDTVAPGGGTPSGVVTFTQKSGSTTTTICASTLSARTPDTATCTTSYANVGNRTVTATYAGTANYVGSVSNALIMSVAPARTTTLLSASPVPSVTGQGLTLTATVVAVAPSTGTPTGKVDFVVESAGNQAIACTGGNSKTLSGGTATCVIAGSKLTASDSPLGVLAGYEGTSAYQPSSTSTNEPHQPSGNDDDGELLRATLRHRGKR